MSIILTFGEDKDVVEIPVIFSAFPDGDTHCVIEDAEAVAGKPVLVRHNLYPNQNEQIVRLVLLLDLLRDLGATSISVVVPYLPYSRQDKRHLAGEAVSAFTLCKLLSVMGVETLYTFDCHFMKGVPHTVQGGLHIENLSLGAELLQHVGSILDGQKFEVIGPDKGSNYLVKDSGGKNMKKERGNYTVDENGVKQRAVSKLEHSHLAIQEKTVVIMDDMISTGGTLLKAVETLQSNGIEDIYCAAVHGLFINGCLDKLRLTTKGIFVSDSIPADESIDLVDKTVREKIIPHWTKCA